MYAKDARREQITARYYILHAGCAIVLLPLSILGVFWFQALNCTRSWRPFAHALFALFKDPVNRHLATHTETRMKHQTPIGESIFVTLLGGSYTLSWSFDTVYSFSNHTSKKITAYINCVYEYIKYMSILLNLHITPYYTYYTYVSIYIYTHIIGGRGLVVLAETAP